MIAFTQTLSTWGGNYYVSKGLGFLYNDHFRGGGGRGGGIRQHAPAHALVVHQRADAGVRARRPARRAGAGVRWVRAADGRRRGRQCVDPGIGLQHHPERRGRRHAGAAGDRGAADADRRRRRRAFQRADRRPHSAVDPRGPRSARPHLHQGRPQRRSEIRLRGRRRRRCRQSTPCRPAPSRGDRTAPRRQGSTHGGALFSRDVRVPARVEAPQHRAVVRRQQGSVCGAVEAPMLRFIVDVGDGCPR